jgi:predicted nucleotidyltransferase
MAAPLRSTLTRALRGALAVLDAAGVRAALVGGIAVASRTEPRFTRDVDLAIGVASDEDAEALVARFVARGYRVAATVEHRRTGRLMTVRLLPPRAPAGAFVDLLFAATGVEQEIVRGAEVLELAAGVTVPVARVGHLIAMKVLSYDPVLRARDLVDLQALLAVASRQELAEARRTLALIRQRGHARGIALLKRLDALRRRFG